MNDQAKSEPDRSELYAALAEAQGEIKAVEQNQESEIKNREGKFLYSFKYADLTACLEVAREPLSKNGLSIIQLPSLGDAGEVCMTTILAHESGQSISAEMAMKPDREGPQAIGSVITYLRRYMLCAMVGISQTDDDARAAAKLEGEFVRMSARDIDEVLGKADALFGERADNAINQMLKKVFNKGHLADLPTDQLVTALKSLENAAQREKKLAKDAKKSPVAEKKKEREPGEDDGEVAPEDKA